MLALALGLGAALATTASGCGDDACGPGSAGDSGLSASSVDVTLAYGNLEGGLNNDCPDADAPAGVVSLTIAGMQVDGTGLFTLCVPRPDLLGTQELALGIDSPTSEVRIIDTTGDANGCTFRFDRTRPPTGTATATGLCDDGANPAGFALVVDGAISLERTCGSTVDQVGVTLKGTAAVAGPPS